jgi:hypothetical protein
LVKLLILLDRHPNLTSEVHPGSSPARAGSETVRAVAASAATLQLGGAFSRER